MRREAIGHEQRAIGIVEATAHVLLLVGQDHRRAPMPTTPATAAAPDDSFTAEERRRAPGAARVAGAAEASGAAEGAACASRKPGLAVGFAEASLAVGFAEASALRSASRSSALADSRRFAPRQQVPGALLTPLHRVGIEGDEEPASAIPNRRSAAGSSLANGSLGPRTRTTLASSGTSDASL